MAGADAERTEPEVTVVVPTRNRAGYLSDCLASLAAQRCRGTFEVLVVDNGSTDETPAVIERWCRDDPRFRTTVEPRPGLSSAKNAGIRSALGGLLLFTDDDTIVGEGWIDAYLDLLEAAGNDTAVAGGPVVPVPHDLGPWPDWFERTHLADLGLLDHGAERPLGRFEYVWGGNMAVPAATFERFGMWDESVGRRGDERGTFEDAEFQDRLRDAGGTVLFCPRAVVQHRLVRTEVTLARVVGQAFAPGRKEHAPHHVLNPKGSDGSPGSVAGPLARLGGNLCGWLWWTSQLRAFKGHAMVDRARRAAWRSGWSLDVIQSGWESGAVSRLAGEVAIAVRNLALWVTPGRA
jgi:GT2 family glycosyltransferase